MDHSAPDASDADPDYDSLLDYLSGAPTAGEISLN